MRQIIKNGTIVTGSGSFPADIAVYQKWRDKKQTGG